MNRLKIDNAQGAQAPRSKQNLSCNWLGSADFGRLIPIHWEELVEGDHVIRCRPRIEMQMLSLASPTFSKIDLYCHYFVVPIRQLQKDFYDIWSKTGVAKDEDLQWTNPVELAEMYNTGSGQTYDVKRAMFKHWTSLGLNPFFEMTGNYVINDGSPVWLAPWLAYNKIWWDFYRDPEVLRDESAEDYLFVGNRQDFVQMKPYFALKYMMPHVRSIKNCWISDLFASGGYDPTTDLYNTFTYDQPYNIAGKEVGFIANEDYSPAVGQFDADNNVNTGDSNTAPQIRLIEALTRLAERLSLSGKRQIEQLYSRYGVKPKWSVMNLARYVGGAKSSVLVDNIISTSDTSSQGGDPLGAKAGAGYCAMDNLNIEVSVDEPSILMGIVSVMPHIHFVQGLSKKFCRRYLTDMFQSELQYTGNSAVAKREVAFRYRGDQLYNDSENGQTFAWSDPYYEYKMGLDTLAGDFMKYHGVQIPTDPQQAKDVRYMQSMENYIDFPSDRKFNLDNLLVDGDQYNKIFNYLGGGIFTDSDDHFHLCIDKEVIIDRPMEGFAIPTLETTKDPHAKTQGLSSDKML